MPSAVEYPPLRKRREGTGHPLYWLRQQNRKPGPPASPGHFDGTAVGSDIEHYAILH